MLITLLMKLGRVYTESESFHDPGVPGLIFATALVFTILVFFERRPCFYDKDMPVLLATTGMMWCLLSKPIVDILDPTLDQGTLLA